MRSTRPFGELNESVKQGGYFDLHESINNKKLVVKELRLDSLEFIRDSFIKREKPPQPDEIAKQTQDYIRFLRTHSEQVNFIPRAQAVIGPNQHGETTAYIIMDKIEGQPLSEVTLTDSDKEEIKHIIRTMVDLYIQNFDGIAGNTLQLGGLINFIKGRNLMNDQGEKIYLVDLYPVFYAQPIHIKTDIYRLVNKTGIADPELESYVARLDELK